MSDSKPAPIAKVYMVEVYDECDFGEVDERFATLSNRVACDLGERNIECRNAHDEFRGWRYRVFELPLRG